MYIETRDLEIYESLLLIFSKKSVTFSSRMFVKRSIHLRVLLLVAMVIVCCGGQRNPITLEDGGYGNLLIAIQKDVIEDENIIQRLKVYQLLI